MVIFYKTFRCLSDAYDGTYTINLEHSCKFLVLMYMCLSIKLLKNSMYSCTEVYNLNKNYVCHVKNQHSQEVEDGYTFVKKI